MGRSEKRAGEERCQGGNRRRAPTDRVSLEQVVMPDMKLKSDKKSYLMHTHLECKKHFGNSRRQLNNALGSSCIR